MSVNIIAASLRVSDIAASVGPLLMERLCDARGQVVKRCPVSMSMELIVLVSYEFFNLLRKPRQIRTSETYFWCRHTIAFHIGWDMLVMRKGGSQCWVMWMRKVIIPI